jgi:hypothetical protein
MGWPTTHFYIEKCDTPCQGHHENITNVFFKYCPLQNFLQHILMLICKNTYDAATRSQQMQETRLISQHTAYRHIAHKAYSAPAKPSIKDMQARYTGFTTDWTSRSPRSLQTAVCSRHLANIGKILGQINLDAYCPYCAGKLA